MSDIIEFMDWIDLQKSLNLINEQVSGMTAAEAEAALGALKNSNLYIANTNTTIGASSVINFPGTTAAEAAGEYIAGGGATAASGAAVGVTGDAVGTANIAIGQTTIGKVATAVYGALSMPLPTAVAALAPLAGVALGAGLYNLNPEFWTKLSQTLLPFCYDDSELLPVMSDAQGNTYYSNDAINAVKALFAQYAGGSYINNSYNPSDYPNGKLAVDYDKFNPPIQFNILPAGIHNWCTFKSGSDTGYVFIELQYDMPYILAHTTTPSAPYMLEFISPNATQYNIGIMTNTTGKIPTRFTHPSANALTVLDSNNIDRRAWYTTIGDIEGLNITLPIHETEAPWNTEDYVKIFYSNTTTEERNLPTGTSSWNGENYPDTATPINILTGYDDNGQPIYTPYYPVSTPIGDPGVSNDPAVNPNPAVNPDPAPVINPVISPVPNPNLYPDTVPVPEPAPIPNPVPKEQPVPAPDVDPSEDAEKNPDKDPDSPKDPTDDGITPTPVIPTIPTLPSAATGLLHVYNPTQSQIDAFGSWLWTTFSGDLIDTLSKLFNDPMDAVIGLHELYATPAVSGGATIRCGYLDSGINANLVGSRYTTINCGSVVVEEYYQNYLDYSPYTSCFIYLPFVGIVPVSSDDIIGNAVNVTYHIDSYTGCCIAVVTVAKSGYSSTVYQFEGNCAVEIPISSGYQSSLMSGLLAVAGTAITSSPAIGMTAAHMGRAGLGKNTVQHSGSFGSSYGAMGNKVPYIIVKRPVQKKVYNYSKSYGFPAHKMVYVGNCQGYLRAKEVRVTSTTATNVEKDMIVNALTSGVYVK